MRRRRFGILAGIVGVGLLLAFAILLRGGPPEAGEHGEHAAGEESARTGPHGGRLLEDGSFALEVTIFERGVPPEFRVFPYRDGARLDPSDVWLRVELHRLDGRVDEIGFAPRGDHLVGDRTVEEPHSFDVKVSLRVDGEARRFEYASYEGRVDLPEEARAAAGIELANVGPARIRTTLPLNGRIVPNEDALAHIMPRFPGIVREVRRRIGDPVARHEVLAVIESNESLHPYEVRSHVAGTVIFKRITPGEFVSTDRVIYAVADLSRVWADLDVYRQDYPRLRVGQAVTLSGGPGAPPVESTISYLSPVGSQGSQTLLARAVLPNPEGLWPPGLFVRGEVAVDVAEVPLTVRAEAVQRLRDWDVVFVRFGSTFEARPIELGRRDAEFVEVLTGLEPGWSYATTNSFVLKADVEKAGASHDH